MQEMQVDWIERALINAQQEVPRFLQFCAEASAEAYRMKELHNLKSAATAEGTASGG